MQVKESYLDKVGRGAVMFAVVMLCGCDGEDLEAICVGADEGNGAYGAQIIVVVDGEIWEEEIRVAGAAP